MIGYKRIFVDTAPFIYYIEQNPEYFDKAKRFFMQAYEDDVELVTSVITMEEYLVFPYRNNSHYYISLFDRLITTLGIKVVSIDEVIAKKAAGIRAEYKAFKAMDALQIATAMISGCDLFLTNDKQLRQFRDVKCITVDEWE